MGFQEERRGTATLSAEGVCIREGVPSTTLCDSVAGGSAVRCVGPVRGVCASVRNQDGSPNDLMGEHMVLLR